METVVARVWMESARGVVLDRLWQSLVRTLRRRAPRADAAADVASEVVHRAIRRLFSTSFSNPVAWDELWAWSLRVAGNLIADEVRRRRRERRDPGASVDELVAKDPRGHATHGHAVRGPVRAMRLMHA